MIVPKHTEELLEDLAESLQIPESHLEAAQRSYQSVGEWLHREESEVRDADPQVYVQGSFRLGTAIRPASGGDYDLDLVCELSFSKSKVTQAELKAGLGRELKAYAKRHQMNPPEEGRRCWTLDYADSARFHMDTLPAILDGERQRLLFERRGYSTQWSETAIAITDRDHPNFRILSEAWPHSNPKGYANWFRSRMRLIFEARRKALALEARASIEAVPEYKVRTPLQSAIQILKHHRDVMFADEPDDKPISIIPTTLAAHAYGQEETISEALYTILCRMDQFIEDRNGIAWIANPTDPAENFADRWLHHPEREEAFYRWLQQARADFTNAAKAINRETAAAYLQPRLGRQLVEAADARRRATGKSATLSRILNRARRVLNPVHKQTPPWSFVQQGEVEIRRATMDRRGFRTEEFGSDGAVLPKHASLRFEAATNIPFPHQVYWQVVNTGSEAEAASGLRGGFDQGIVSSGRLVRDETTLYRGTHSIECFVVKNGLLVAKSGQFIVNIQ